MTQRILVIEDQDDLRAILRDFLTASGYDIVEAVDGGEGVAKARSLVRCSTRSSSARMAFRCSSRS